MYLVYFIEKELRYREVKLPRKLGKSVKEQGIEPRFSAVLQCFETTLPLNIWIISIVFKEAEACLGFTQKWSLAVEDPMGMFVCGMYE